MVDGWRDSLCRVASMLFEKMIEFEFAELGIETMIQTVLGALFDLLQIRVK
jgi:hypothetical protein